MIDKEAVRKDRAAGMRYADIAEKHGCSKQYMQAITFVASENGGLTMADDRIRLYWLHQICRKTCKTCYHNYKKNECDINIGRWRDDMFCSYWRKKRVDDGK